MSVFDHPFFSTSSVSLSNTNPFGSQEENRVEEVIFKPISRSFENPFEKLYTPKKEACHFFGGGNIFGQSSQLVEISPVSDEVCNFIGNPFAQLSLATPKKPNDFFNGQNEFGHCSDVQPYLNHTPCSLTVENPFEQVILMPMSATSARFFEGANVFGQVSSAPANSIQDVDISLSSENPFDGRVSARTSSTVFSDGGNCFGLCSKAPSQAATAVAPGVAVENPFGGQPSPAGARVQYADGGNAFGFVSTALRPDFGAVDESARFENPFEIILHAPLQTVEQEQPSKRANTDSSCSISGCSRKPLANVSNLPADLPER